MASRSGLYDREGRRRRRAGRRLGPTAGPGGPLRPRERHADGPGGRGAGPGRRHTRGHRRRRPTLRGDRLGGHRRPVPWSVGARRPTCRCRSAVVPTGPWVDSCCRDRPTAAGCSKAGSRRPGPCWPGSGASPGARPRSWPNWPAVPARCRGSGGHAVAGGCPGPVVAGRRHGRVRRPAPGARTGRTGPRRVRVGGLGPPALSGGHGPPPTGRTPGVRAAPGWPGSGVAVWIDVLTGITGLPVDRRRSGQAASAGAAVLAARAVGMECPTSTSSTRSGCGRSRSPRRWQPTGPSGAVRIGPLPPCSAWAGRRRRRVTTGRLDPAAHDRVAMRRPPTAGTARAPDAGLRPPRAGRRGARRRRGGGASAPPPLADEAGAVRDALRAPHVGSGPRGPGPARGPGGGGLPRPDPADAEHHRAAAAAGRAGAGRCRARPGRAALRHRDPPPGHGGGDGRAGRSGHRRAGTGSTSTGPTTGTTCGWGRSTARRSCSTGATSRPTGAS